MGRAFGRPGSSTSSRRWVVDESCVAEPSPTQPCLVYEFCQRWRPLQTEKQHSGGRKDSRETSRAGSAGQCATTVAASTP